MTSKLPQEDNLTLGECAAHLRMSYCNMWIKFKARPVPGMRKIGKKWLIPKEAFLEWASAKNHESFESNRGG